jgi:hypothetical protein
MLDETIIYWQEELEKCRGSLDHFRMYIDPVEQRIPKNVRIIESLPVSRTYRNHFMEYLPRELFDLPVTGKAIITSTPTGKYKYSEKPVNIKNYKIIRYEI